MNKNLTAGVIIVIIILVVTITSSLYQTSFKDAGLRLVNNAGQNRGDSAYKDGVYEVNGEYISPGGAEEIGVVLTIQDGIIVDSEVETKATRDISLEMQTDFKANYKLFVIGKNIDEVRLTKVSGSSLTPNGFNDALEKVKQAAGS